jgi:hypothetical protein
MFLAFFCLIAQGAGYARPQAKQKQRSTTQNAAARPSSTDHNQTPEAGLTSAGQQTNANITVQSVGGSGSSGSIPLWTSSTSLGNSTMRYDLFNNLSINGTAYPNTELTINAGSDSGLKILSTGTDGLNVKGGTNGVYAEANTIGVNATGGSTGVAGNGGNTGVSGSGNTGVYGGGTQGPGVYGTSSGGYGVRGYSEKTYGVYATSEGFAAIYGQGTGNTGVLGTSDSAKGLWGTSSSGVGVQGQSSTGFSGKFYGKVAIVASGANPADLSVEGMLSKGGGSFKIDHPLDPENKYLYHSFVESPDMKNIYDGNITTDENGEALVTMPDYFEALNTDFRYQLTVIGSFAQAIVGEEIKSNRFVIKTSQPNVKVSWQVTGVRQDAFARKNRIQVEVEKEEKERGFFLHPEAFNQPVERGIEQARNPELRRQSSAAQEPEQIKKPNDADGKPR